MTLRLSKRQVKKLAKEYNIQQANKQNKPSEETPTEHSILNKKTVGWFIFWLVIVTAISYGCKYLMITYFN